jgi:hypothetical protein
MKSLSGREFPADRGARLAIAASQRQPSYLRQAGSVVRLSVPIHANRPLKTGLLRHLAKLAGIAEDDLR